MEKKDQTEPKCDNASRLSHVCHDNMIRLYNLLPLYKISLPVNVSQTKRLCNEIFVIFQFYVSLV